MFVKHSDKIRIPIQQQNLYTLLCECFQGSHHRRKIDVKERGEENADRRLEIIACRSFDDIRYEFNGTEIDYNRIDVGMTMKGSYEELCIVFR